VVYHPYTQDLRSIGGVTFELRTDADPTGMASTIRTIVREADSRVPVSSLNTQSRIIDQTINQERTFAQLCVCFAVLALLISSIGLYGTMAYSVARRTSEIGIRMALGAARRRVVWSVLSEVLRLAATGLTIGIALVWGTSRYLESFLYEVKPNDAVAMSMSVLILAAASVLAGYVPAARASRIDPITALRHE
jgi:macrolide transport system ATP-binding/permease protein